MIKYIIPGVPGQEAIIPGGGREVPQAVPLGEGGLPGAALLQGTVPRPGTGLLPATAVPAMVPGGAVPKNTKSPGASLKPLPWAAYC